MLHPWVNEDGFHRVSNIFEGGGSKFFQGVQMLISIETNITCDFQGGPDPLSPIGSPHVD